MTDLTIGERLIVVETKLDTVQTEAKDREKKQDEILDKLTAIELQMAQTKSFMGGAMWIGVGMVSILWKLGPWLINLFKAKTGS